MMNSADEQLMARARSEANRHESPMDLFDDLVNEKFLRMKEARDNEPKVFLTRFGRAIRVAFRIGNQTFELDRTGGKEDDLEHANWQANMLRSAFKQERKPLEEDPLLSKLNNNEPIDAQR